MFAVLIPFMSGKIGYDKFTDIGKAAWGLNPFYVREDWLRYRGEKDTAILIVLIPFMSGKIGYRLKKAVKKQITS